MRKHVFTLVLLFCGTLFYSEVADAIPAFARKYRMSCQTCHSPSAPKLKDYGDDFAGDGFKLEDEEAPRHYVNTGDQKLSLIRDFPLAMRLDGFVSYHNGNGDGSDFGSPYLLKLMSGSELSEHLSYYFYFYMDERGEVAGVEDAFLMYDNLFDTELDIVLGQFQVSDPLFKRELRLTLEDYHVYTPKIGISDITLKYDKGLMLSYGFETGTDVTVEVVNGNGLAEAGDNHVFDKDRYKNYVGRISQNIGENLRIGVFGMYGKEKQENSLGTEITNEVIFAGPDLTLTLSSLFELNFQYIYREDDQVYEYERSINPVSGIETTGMLGELIFTPKGDQSDWYLTGMYNWVDSDFDPADYQSATFHVGYLLRRNIRLAGEYNLNLTDPDDPFGEYSIGFVSAF